MKPIDILIAGAGPAGLATAIRVKRRLREAGQDATVVVFDKAPKLGYHNLSGAVFEPHCLDLLIPDWRQQKNRFLESIIQVEQDELYYLTETDAYRIPQALVPPPMRHKGDYIISISLLVRWLGSIAQEEGVEIHLGFSGQDVLMDGNKVLGVRLVDQGRSTHHPNPPNYLPGEEIQAKVTVLADGSRGVLSRELTNRLPPSRNPQVYSIGLKQLIKLPPDRNFGKGRAIHTIGYPLPADVFGGGFLYDMGNNEVAVGLIIGLDWPYSNLNPQQELEAFKSHPFIAELLKGGQVIATGVKTIPEGGYYSLPPLVTDGALLTGDAAGFVDMRKIKGIHYAIYSGICAGDTLFEAFQKNDFSESTLQSYRQKLEPYVLNPMWKARNFRQVFKYGLYLGAPLSRIQHLLPVFLRIEPDYKATKPNRRLPEPKVEGMDKATFVSLSGANHREDEPSHILIKDPALCERCIREYGAPCVHLCPGEVYRVHNGKLILSPSNCMHDGSCHVKCPFQNIVWTPPEGGEGPRYKKM